jgi:hypothetical protein
MQVRWMDLRGLSVLEVTDRLRLAYHALNNYSKQAHIARTSWLEQLSAARASVGNNSAEQEYKILIHREKQRRNARIIRFTFAAGCRSGLAKVHQTMSDGSVVDVTEKCEMEALLSAELTVRFNQAFATPFLQPPLFPLVGVMGTSDPVQDFLHGQTFLDSSVPEWMVKFLQQLQYNPAAASIQQEFCHRTVKDYLQG